MWPDDQVLDGNTMPIEFITFPTIPSLWNQCWIRWAIALPTSSTGMAMAFNARAKREAVPSSAGCRRWAMASAFGVHVRCEEGGLGSLRYVPTQADPRAFTLFNTDEVTKTLWSGNLVEACT